MKREALAIEVVRSGPETARLRLRGDLDFETAGSLVSAAATARGDGFRQLEVDLSGLGMCDSSGLSALIDIFKAGERTGGSVRLTDVGDQLRRLLHRTGLDDVLGVGEPSPEHRSAEPPTRLAG
ncbi:STAS domain-containing protein [Micromonospora zhanjiangensis]|uniref:STAS domain-containing protein n=1 Tax=Micromonospora zhanjiangensis TaxID=1522057 RepID=A0ABV8KTG5_9ACTN